MRARIDSLHPAGRGLRRAVGAVAIALLLWACGSEMPGTGQATPCNTTAGCPARATGCWTVECINEVCVYTRRPDGVCEPDAGGGVDAGTDRGGSADGGVGSDAGVDAGTEADAVADAETGTEADAVAETDTATETDIATDTDTDTGAVLDAETGADAGAETDAGIDPCPGCPEGPVTLLGPDAVYSRNLAGVQLPDKSVWLAVVDEQPSVDDPKVFLYSLRLVHVSKELKVLFEGDPIPLPEGPRTFRIVHAVGAGLAVISGLRGEGETPARIAYRAFDLQGQAQGLEKTLVEESGTSELDLEVRTSTTGGGALLSWESCALPDPLPDPLPPLFLPICTIQDAVVAWPGVLLAEPVDAGFPPATWIGNLPCYGLAGGERWRLGEAPVDSYEKIRVSLYSSGGVEQWLGDYVPKTGFPSLFFCAATGNTVVVLYRGASSSTEDVKSYTGVFHLDGGAVDLQEHGGTWAPVSHGLTEAPAHSNIVWPAFSTDTASIVDMRFTAIVIGNDGVSLVAPLTEAKAIPTSGFIPKAWLPGLAFWSESGGGALPSYVRALYWSKPVTPE